MSTEEGLMTEMLSSSFMLLEMGSTSYSPLLLTANTATFEKLVG